MNVSRAVIKTLKKQNYWTTYKRAFTHPQMRLLVTHLATKIGANNDPQLLVALEKMVLQAPKNEHMFIAAFEQLGALLGMLAYDWKALGECAWYCFQTSTYWRDKRTKASNIFNEHNFVTMNMIKRQCFYRWLHSIPKTHHDFNLMVTTVLKEMF